VTRAIAVLLAVSVMALTACGKDDEGDRAGTGSTQQPAPPAQTSAESEAPADDAASEEDCGSIAGGGQGVCFSAPYCWASGHSKPPGGRSSPSIVMARATAFAVAQSAPFALMFSTEPRRVRFGEGGARRVAKIGPRGNDAPGRAESR
jgi:hypothetical protein